MDMRSEIMTRRGKLELRRLKLEMELGNVVSEIEDFDAALRVLDRLEQHVSAESSSDPDKPKLTDLALKVVNDHPAGIRTGDIAVAIEARFGVAVNANSLGGTMARHREAGRVRHSDGIWYPTAATSPSGEEPGAGTPGPLTASQSLEAAANGSKGNGLL